MVSIIIPTYNRYSYLGETLNSILRQTYKDWECLVVDDGSDDFTPELMEFYCGMDRRIRFLIRPQNRNKGANACRNYGFEQSKGDLIQWFDSDDIMTVDHLEKKVAALEESRADYVIARSYYFKDDSKEILSYNQEYYRFKDYAISNYNYVCQNINWLTYDFMGRRGLVEKVRFNENLQSFQERNYFCKLTIYSVNLVLLNNYLTAVRSHDNSIQSNLRKNKDRYYDELQKFFYETWLELKNRACVISAEYLFSRSLRYSMHYKTRLTWLIKLSQNLYKKSHYKSLGWFLIFQISFYLTGKGYRFRKRVLSNYEEL